MSNNPEAKPRTNRERYGPALNKAKRAFPNLDPIQAATYAAVAYNPLGCEQGVFKVPLFGEIHQVYWPDAKMVDHAGQDVDITTQILLLHYLLTADGTPLASEWVAFRNLPGGMGYDAAFQGRSSLRILGRFGKNLPAFETASKRLSGERLTFGDASFMFRAMPRVWMAVVLYLADDEFPASLNMLFDGAASHYLPTEDLAVLGGMLASRLKRNS